MCAHAFAALQMVLTAHGTAKQCSTHTKLYHSVLQYFTLLRNTFPVDTSSWYTSHSGSRPSSSAATRAQLGCSCGRQGTVMWSDAVWSPWCHSAPTASHRCTARRSQLHRGPGAHAG
jgi:hypothetical protein